MSSKRVYIGNPDLPEPTWWTCVNVREYVITQTDIDAALRGEP